MKIDYLIVDDKKFNFNIQSTLIFSNENSKGKSSLVRLILYALGYAVPSTKGFEFSKLNLEIQIERNDKLIKLRRNDSTIEVINSNSLDVYKLPEESSEVLAIVFDVTEPRIVDNLLGLIYFDQDKGWTLLNRGIVIGKIRFKIEDLIGGLTDNNTKQIQLEITEKQNERKSFLQIKTLLALNKKQEMNASKMDWTSLDDLQDKVRSIDMELNKKKNQIKKLESVVNGNKNFLELIKDMHILVQVDKKTFRLSKENIVGYKFNETVAIAQLTREKRDLDTLTVEKNKLVKELNNQLKLFSNQDQIQRFNTAISNINISEDSMDSMLSKNSKEIARLKRIQKDSLNLTNQVNDIYKNVVKFSKILDIESSIDDSNDFIFTQNLKRYSGAKLHLLVFGFRLAILKVVELQLGQSFPIIIDSPMSGEVDEDNVKRMFDLLDYEFPKNQKIIASIFKYGKEWDSVITLEDMLMNAGEHVKHSK